MHSLKHMEGSLMAVASVQDYMVAAFAVNSMQDGRGGGPQPLPLDSGGEAARPVSASDAVQKAQQENDDAHEAQKQKQVSEEQAAYITKQLNEIMRRIDVNLNFQYHKEVNVMSVRMLDKKTGELLREIPAASMIDHMIKARDWIGTFLDKMA